MRGQLMRRLGRWTLVSLALGGLVLAVLVNPVPRAEDLLEMATVLVYAGVGVVVTRQRPENAVGWVFLLIAGLLGLVGGSAALVETVQDSGPPAAWWAVLGAWVYSWAWLPLLMLATSFTFLLYPSGVASTRWRWVLHVTVGYTVVQPASAGLWLSGSHR